MNMGSTPYPRTWIPYVNTKDCSQGSCSFHCPQWCYVIFPPPPPFEFSDENDSRTSFSPLVIAIIGILGSAFLLVSYYAIISKYCKNSESSSSRRRNHVPSMEMEENRDPSYHGPWNVSENGLDESLIKSITMFKYKKEDGLTEVADCSICLSEFQEDESLRLLPKCSHAFHVTCIDPWFKSHSNCPLCRTIIVSIDGSPPPVIEAPPDDNNSQVPDDIEMGLGRQEIVQSDAPATLERAPNIVQNVDNCSIVTDVIGDEEHLIRRSVSMDIPRRHHVSIADILHTSDDEDYHIESEFQGDVGPSKEKSGEISNSNNVLHCVKRPVGMKRSFSSGRFTFSNRRRGKSTILPL